MIDPKFLPEIDPMKFVQDIFTEQASGSSQPVSIRNPGKYKLMNADGS